MQILQIPVLRDNYIYLIHTEGSDQTAVIDPAEAAPVLSALRERGWRLTHIFNTHHHADHVGGNLELQHATGARIHGASGPGEPIPGLDEPVSEGLRIAFGEMDVEVWAVPGHTRHHLAFWLPGAGALFCGDTLFGMGCGRLLGGTAEQLWQSLDRLRRLPADTLIYCAHEYTQNNGRFAASVEPDNSALQARLREVDRLRSCAAATVPFRLEEEWATNPFLRPESPTIRASLGLPDASDQAVFAELRRRKDLF